MLGPEGASALVLELCRTHLPGKLVELSGRLGLDKPLLEPKRFSPTMLAKRAIGDFPSVEAVIWDTPRIRPADRDEMREIYGVDYRFRVYVWVRGKDHVNTELNRARYCLALREVLLEHADLDSPLARLDTSSLTEVYADVVDVKALGSISAFFTGFEVTIDETMTTTSLGTISDGMLEVVPSHPALDD